MNNLNDELREALATLVKCEVERQVKRQYRVMLLEDMLVLLGAVVVGTILCWCLHG